MSRPVRRPPMPKRTPRKREGTTRPQQAAKAPADPKFTIEHIGERSQHARTNWFGLLALLAFVGVTLLGHEDADFFALGVETDLPLVGFAVPTRAFFSAAAAFTMALYIYLHLYLVELWHELGGIEQEEDASPLSRRVYPWLLTQSALWYRNRRRGDGSSDQRVFGWLTAAISLLFGWGFGLMILAILWWRSMAAHDEWLTLVIGVFLAASLGVGVTTLLTAEKMMRGVAPEDAARATTFTRLALWAMAAFIATLSWLRAEGGFENYAPWIERQEAAIRAFWAEPGGADDAPATRLAAGLPTTREIEGWLGVFRLDGKERDDPPFWLDWLRLYPADLREAMLTPRPADWQEYDLWLQEQTDAWLERRKVEGAEIPAADLPAFRAETKRRWAQRMANIAAPDLKFADLRRANLRKAFLSSADLRGANLDGANLFGARLQGARLGCWDVEETEEDACTNLRRAVLTGAQMQGADLGGAQLQGADLRRAAMQGADLSGVNMPGADLTGADLRYAILRGALVRESSLRGAQMQEALLQDVDLSRANLNEVVFAGALLWGSQMHEIEVFGANLSETALGGTTLQSATIHASEMQRVNFGYTSVIGTIFSNVNMQNSSCELALFGGVIIESSNFLCLGLPHDQIKYSVSDEQSRLPHGLTLLSCLEETEDALPAKVRDALNKFPDSPDGSRRPVRNRVLRKLLCDRDTEGNLTEQPKIIMGTWVPLKDGNWLDEATGNIFAPGPDSEWVETRSPAVAN